MGELIDKIESMGFLEVHCVFYWEYSSCETFFFVSNACLRRELPSPKQADARIRIGVEILLCWDRIVANFALRFHTWIVGSALAAPSVLSWL